MTKEEAKSFLINISYKFGNMAIEYLTEKDGDKMREAIEVLAKPETITEFADRCKECGKMKRCKDCRHFEYDSVAKVDGIPLIVAHEICKRWGEGCKTSEDGYCFLFEPKEDEDERQTES